MSHHEPAKRRTTETVLGLGALALAGAAGWWFLAGSGADRGGLDGPVDEAVTPTTRVAADLSQAGEATPRPEEVPDERIAMAPFEERTPADEVAAQLAGTGSIEGVFLAPGDLPRDAVVELRFAGMVEQDVATVVHEETRELPVREPWKLAELAAATWRVKATVRDGQRTWSSETVELELLEDAALRGVTLALVEYAVEGLVTDLNGFPVANVAVELTWTDVEDDFSFPMPKNDTWTRLGDLRLTHFANAEGEYAIEVAQQQLDVALTEFDRNLRTSRERVMVTRLQDIAEQQAQVEELEASIAAQEAAIEALLMERARVVTQSDALEHLSYDLAEFAELGDVLVQDEPFEDTRPRSDAGGRYRLSLPGPGRYGVRVEGVDVELIAEDGEIQVTVVEPVALHDFQVVRAARLSGTVAVFSGASPDDVYCFLRREGTNDTDVDGADADGTYSFSRLWPGMYDFYARGGGDKGQDFSHHVRIKIEEGAELVHDPILEPSYTVEGRLTGGDGAYAKAEITAWGNNNPNLKRYATARADGSFTLKGLYPSEYRITVKRGKRDLPLAEECVFYVDLEHPPTLQTVVLAVPEAEGEGR